MPTQKAVSESLDSIAQVPGDMIFRNNETWVRIPGGNPGQVLQYNGTIAVPSWVDGGGGGMSNYTPPTVLHFPNWIYQGSSTAVFSLISQQLNWLAKPPGFNLYSVNWFEKESSEATYCFGIRSTQFWLTTTISGPCLIDSSTGNIIVMELKISQTGSGPQLRLNSSGTPGRTESFLTTPTIAIVGDIFLAFQEDAGDLVFLAGASPETLEEFHRGAISSILPGWDGVGVALNPYSTSVEVSQLSCFDYRLL